MSNVLVNELNIFLILSQPRVKKMRAFANVQVVSSPSFHLYNYISLYLNIYISLYLNICISAIPNVVSFHCPIFSHQHPLCSQSGFFIRYIYLFTHLPFLHQIYLSFHISPFSHFMLMIQKRPSIGRCQKCPFSLVFSYF